MIVSPRRRPRGDAGRVSFDSIERSVSQSQPIFLFTIATPTITYQHTNQPVDVPFGGDIFTTLTIDCGPTALGNDPGVTEQTITLPISHPFVQQYAGTGLPELVITVTIQRLQPASGTAQQLFTGVAQSLSCDVRTATIRCPATTADALKIQLPIVGATRTCNHRLFDGRCAPVPGGQWPPLGPSGSGGPAPGLFTISDVVISSISTDGLTIVVSGGTPDALSTKPSGWAALGRIILGSSDQRRILTQISTTITLAVPFPGLMTGTRVTIEAGCLHDMATCKSKFNNQLNFGGHPLMSSFDPWASNGFGIIQQV